MRKKTNFIKLIRVWGILFLVGPGAIFVTIDIIRSYSELNSRASQIRSDYIDHQKETIKQEVLRVADLIRYAKSQSENLTRRKIKSRVDEAYSIAQNIYQQNRALANKSEIQKIILDALRPIRFENGSGYYFATRLDGVEILFADKPDMEGLNLLDLQDTQGNYVIKDMIEIAKESGEGFYEYQWTKPASAGKDFKKISYIKLFAPCGFFIGTGLYVVDVESEIKADILSTISRIRFGKEGYIFVNNLNGDALVSNGKIFSGTKKMWEVFNDEPEKMKDIFEKEYQAALKPEGDYIYYSWIKLTSSDKESLKTSFVYGMPDLQWLVGAGVYLDDIETDVALMQAELSKKIKTKIIQYVLIVAGICGLFLVFFDFLNRRLKKDIHLFISFFAGAAHSDQEIERDRIGFVELDQMAEYANKMLAERKQSEEALRESGDIFKHVFESANVGKAITLPTGEITVNKAFADLLGYSREELTHKTWQELTPPEEIETIQKILAPILNGEQDSARYIKTYIHKNGSHVLADVSVAIRRDADGKPLHFIVTIVDITERNRIEKQLANTINYVQTIFDKSPIGISTFNANGQIITTNQALAKIVGGTVEKIVNLNIHDIESWRNSGLLSAAEEVLGTGIEKNFEFHYYSSFGKECWVSCLFVRFTHAGEHQLLLLLSDISERKQAEDEREKLRLQLSQLQKMEAIGSLAGGIAHDLNNILFPISGLSEMLLDDISPGDPAHDTIEQIYKSATRGSDLVKQILAFSRQSNPRKLPIRIQPVLKEALKLVRSTIPVNIEITSRIDPDCGMVSADPTQVHQIAMNLITNAYHAVEGRGGTIHLELKEADFESDDPIESGNYARISISDTGTGIDKSLIDKIFDPYFTTKEMGKGTGLGLSVVHGIVKEHGGDIRVFSEAGKGTTFHVFLPLLKESMESKTAPATGKYPTGSERILLVDDEEPIVRLEQMMLERLGYRLTVRVSSPDALETFRANSLQFDLVISDRGMPNMTGEQLARELISIRPEIPIILCTGFADEIDELRARSMGIKGFLKKPVATGDLAAMVRKVLDASKSQASD